MASRCGLYRYWLVREVALADAFASKVGRKTGGNAAHRPASRALRLLANVTGVREKVAAADAGPESDRRLRQRGKSVAR